MHRLTLYTSGKTSLSTRALATVDHVCEKYLAGRYSLEVVDVLEDPARATAARVIATPTLVKEWPLPERAMLCSSVDEKRLLRVLGLPAEIAAMRGARPPAMAASKSANLRAKEPMAEREGSGEQVLTSKPIVTIKHPLRSALARVLGHEVGHEAAPVTSRAASDVNTDRRELKRVLVIDDYEAIRSSFQLALADAPVELLLADSGANGLAALDRTAVDLVYLDLNMAELDGVATLERLRRRHDMPVFVLTAFADEYAQRLNAARRAGLDFELLRKPLEMDEIFLVSGIATGGFGPRVDGGA